MSFVSAQFRVVRVSSQINLSKGVANNNTRTSAKDWKAKKGPSRACGSAYTYAY